MDFKDLTPELQEKAKACNTPEELSALFKEEGYELSDEELEGVAGGVSPSSPTDYCSEVSIGGGAIYGGCAIVSLT